MCPGAVHKPECKARQVVEAYHAMKRTTMPRCVRHRTPESLTQRPGTEGYKCWKVRSPDRVHSSCSIAHTATLATIPHPVSDAHRSLTPHAQCSLTPTTSLSRVPRQVNRSGRMQPRVFVIHASDQRLLNFVEQSAERSQLRKVLPLTQLIQVCRAVRWWCVSSCCIS